MSANPDTRPLSPGWTENYDSQRNVWFYINSNIVPPRMSILHPADVPVTQGPLSSMERLTREPTLNDALDTARRAPALDAMSFAQQLYASALNNQLATNTTSQAPKANLSSDRTSAASESQILGSTMPSILNQSPPRHYEGEGSPNPAALYNDRLGLGPQPSQSVPSGQSAVYTDNQAFATEPVARNVPSSQSPPDHFRRSYTVAALPSRARGQEPSTTSSSQYEPDNSYSPSTHTVLMNPTAGTSPKQEPTRPAPYPSPPQTTSPAPVELSGYPFPAVGQGSDATRVASPSQTSSSPTSYAPSSTVLSSSPTDESPIQGPAAYPASPSSYSAPSRALSSSPVGSVSPSILSWNSGPSPVSQASTHPGQTPHHNFTAPVNFSLPMNYSTHTKDLPTPPTYTSPAVNQTIPTAQTDPTGNYTVPSTAYPSPPTSYTTPAPNLTSQTTPPTNYPAQPWTYANSAPNQMVPATQATFPPNYTTPPSHYAPSATSYTTPAPYQAPYPTATTNMFNQPMGYPSPPASYPTSPMGQPMQAMAYAQQPTGTYVNGRAPAGAPAQTSENKASAKVLLGIAGIVGKSVVQSAVKNKGDVIDTLTNLPTDNNSGGGGTGGGGSSTMNNLASAFSGMMNNGNNGNNGGLPNMGGNWQQPDPNSQYQNMINNQFQQFQQQGQPGTTPNAQQFMQPMHQFQQQMAHQQQQQQLQQQYYPQQQVQQQPYTGGATQGTAVVAPSHAEISAAVGQATKYVKVAAKVAKFAVKLGK